ncbi:MAG: hypothetical protein ACJ77Z_17575 [Thermoleophilaceae bacterium]
MERRLWGVVVLVVAAALALPSAAPGAIVKSVETHTPFTDSRFNPCTGEPLVITGFFHSRVYFDVDPDGSTHFVLELNLENMKATALSGRTYVVKESLETHTNAGSAFVPFNTEFNFVDHFVRAGEDATFVDGDDFYLGFRSHVTVNANGTTTVQRLASNDDTCR